MRTEPGRTALPPTLRQDYQPQPRSGFRPPRWALVTCVLLLPGVWLMVSTLVSLTTGVMHRDARRDAMKTAALHTLPADAEGVVTGFRGVNEAFAIADVPDTSTQVLSRFDAHWGAPRWTEIPGTATSTTRSYLSSGQDRILEITAGPCAVSRAQCPPGGSTVTVEVSVGGPKS